jgi:DNA-binding transcriptional LysR family regulator
LSQASAKGIVRGFHALFPQTRLSILEESSQNQMEALRAGRLDVGIIRPAMGEDHCARARGDRHAARPPARA